MLVTWVYNNAAWAIYNVADGLSATRELPDGEHWRGLAGVPPAARLDDGTLLIAVRSRAGVVSVAPKPPGAAFRALEPIAREIVETLPEGEEHADEEEDAEVGAEGIGIATAGQRAVVIWHDGGGVRISTRR